VVYPDRLEVTGAFPLTIPALAPLDPPPAEGGTLVTDRCSHRVAERPVDVV